ncbi:phosphate ABC transporter permease PstA [Orrella sp. 11846]|uniref:phosphate ABC transporter permease PstA n=1 Tax=Orrella sp. 11846 TaxID=3409913 RepID=UPI003B5C1EE4
MNNSNQSPNSSAYVSAQERLQSRLSKGLRKRHARDRRFRWYGRIAIIAGLSLVILLFGSILYRGLPAMWQSVVHVPVYFDPEIIEIEAKPEQRIDENTNDFNIRLLDWQKRLITQNWQGLLTQTIQNIYPQQHISARDVRSLFTRSAAHDLREAFIKNPDLIGQTAFMDLLTDANVDVWLSGNINRTLSDRDQQVSKSVRELADRLSHDGHIQKKFSHSLFSNTDSRSSPASAGLLGALMGSIFILIIVVIVSVPIGVASAIYLEEFAPKNRWTDLIEVNINNLAAVPSIVFGLLGAAVFINWMGMPLSAPLVAGLVLSLMSLPTVIITTRAALQAVPSSVRQAAQGIGASPMQVVFHHVLPLAAPGVLTGTVLALAQALGETAPLLLIGMNAFVAHVPSTPLDQSTALSVQIFLWQGQELRNFFEGRTASAIILLMTLVLGLKAFAIFLRNQLNKQWKGSNQ